MDLIPFVGIKNNRICFVFGGFSEIKNTFIELIQDTIDKKWQIRGGKLNESILYGYLNLEPKPTQIKCLLCSGKIGSNKIAIFLTTMPDGWHTLVNLVAKKNIFKVISVTFSGNEKSLHIASFQELKNNCERVIQVYYDFDRWVFFERGDVLSYENENYYLKRNIKDRLTNGIILEYLMRSGIDLFDKNILVDSEFVEILNSNNTP